MDKRFQDIHYGTVKTMYSDVVIREVNIKEIIFKESIMIIKFNNGETMILPKLSGYALYID